eukprot:GHVR01133746.1.p1 GENE.GHVR01133746.1~~GHVR01133746.1.p1  ORF type:complete len:396 (+),score=92.26 GHVR01133746.1:59-1246(+)
MEVERTPIAQLEEERTLHPDLSSNIDEMLSMFESKLWHQLTDEALKYIKDPSVYGSTTLESFLLNFIKVFSDRICQVRLVEILRLVCESISDCNRSLVILQQWQPHEQHREANIMWGAVLASFLIISSGNNVSAGELVTAGERLEVVEGLLKGGVGVDIAVNATYHKAVADLKRARGDMGGYYKHSLLFLAFTPLDTLPIPLRPVIALNIAEAALAARDVYNFGELMQLQQGAIQILKDTDTCSWLVDILCAVNSGHLNEFNQSVAKHSDNIRNSLVLKDIVHTELKAKAQLLSLVELSFNKPKKSRKVLFSEVVEVCDVDMSGVELLIMRAMCVGLIKGRIDQVNKELIVTWVQPRILDMNKLILMETRLVSWGEAAHSLLGRLQDQIPDVLVN